MESVTRRLRRIELQHPGPGWQTLFSAVGDRHDWHELVVVNRGDYVVETDDGTLRGTTGASFYYAPGYRHRPRFDLGGRVELFVLQWTQTGEPTAPLGPVQVATESPHLVASLHWLYDLSLVPARPEEDPDLHALIQLILTERFRPSPVSGTLERRVRAFMMQALREPLRVKDLATAVGLSVSQLIHAFHRETGVPPMRYLRQIRVEYAIGLMDGRGFSLAEVGPMVGIPSTIYLARLIRAARRHGRTIAGRKT